MRGNFSVRKLRGHGQIRNRCNNGRVENVLTNFLILIFCLFRLLSNRLRCGIDMRSTSCSDDAHSPGRDTSTSFDLAGDLLYRMDQRGRSLEAGNKGMESGSSSEAELQKSSGHSEPPHLTEPAKSSMAASIEAFSPPRSYEDALAELITQERIIAALQVDNEALRSESKNLHNRNKQLESCLSNLEAKHSLLQSSVHHRTEVFAPVAQKEKSHNSPVSLIEVDTRKPTLANSTTREPLVHMDNGVSCQHEVCGIGSPTEDGRLHSSLISRVNELENVLKCKPEDEVAQLLRRNESTGYEKLENSYQNRVRQLEDALLEKDRCTEAALERLRSESHSIRARYEAKIANLQSQLSCKESNAIQKVEVSGKELALENAVTQQNLVFQVESSFLKQKIEDWSTKSKTVDMQLNTIQRESQSDRHFLYETRRRLDANQQDWEKKFLAFREDFTSQLRAMRHAHNEEIISLQHQHQEEIKCLATASSQSAKANLIERLCQRLGGESPEPFLLGVVEQLSYLDTRLYEKERQASYEISQIQRASHFEIALLKQQMNAITELKDHQINQFRHELDALLSALSSLISTS